MKEKDIPSALARKIEFLPYQDLVDSLKGVRDPVEDPLQYFLHEKISTEQSRKARIRDIRQMVKFFLGKLEIELEEIYAFPFHKLTYHHIQLFYQYSKKKYKLSTANHRLGILRALLKCFVLAGWMGTAEWGKIQLIKMEKHQGELVGRLVSPKEINIVIKMLKIRMDKGETDPRVCIRNMAIIALAYSTGMRTKEIEAINLEDIELDGSVNVIRGKGGKNRRVYLSDSAEIYVNEWINIKAKSHSLFNAFGFLRGNLFIQKTRLKENKIRKAVRWMWKKAGIERFTIHDLRRTYITNLLIAGVDPITVANLAGHSSITTTMIYDRRPEEIKRETRNIHKLDVII